VNVSKQLNLKSRYIFRYLVQIPSIYTPSQKPHIFLFSTRRGGSTLLSNMIYSQPGFNYIDQPLDFTSKQFNPYRKLFLNYGYENGQIIKMTDEQKISIKNYFDKLLNRNYILNSQWQFWSNDYHWFWNRYVVKEVNAKPVMPWFELAFKENALIVYQTRHPFSTASSLLEVKWGHVHNVFLKDEEFVDTYLTPKMYAAAVEIATSGSMFNKYVLDWCLENIIPLRLWNKSSWVTVSFENVVKDPRKACARISTLLDLPAPEIMVNSVFKPNKNTSKKSKKLISDVGPESRLATWRDHKSITSQELCSASQILDVFEIDLYSATSPWARSDFDHYRLD
jgi:hypothetical protein